jgi:hypothetical protein
MDGLEKITSPGGASFWVAKPHADRFRGLIGDLETAGYGIKPKESGGYNYRNIAGTNKLSQHAHGAAVDINWMDNARGSAGNIPPDLARSLAQKHGLKWGGDWKNPDPMHFEVPGQPGHTFGDGHNHGAPPALARTPSDPELPGLMPGAPRPASPMPAAPTGAASAMTPYNGPSPDDVSQSRRMAQMLMQQGMSTEPVGHWTQALARVLQGGVGGMYQSQAKQGEQQGTQAMVQALSGGQMNPAAMVANPWTRQFGMELAKTQFSQNTPMAQAQLAAAQGQERREAELHPIKVQAQQQAMDAASIGQLDPDKITYRKKKDGTFEIINPGGAELGPSPAGIKSEAELRKEYTAQPQVKEYQTVRTAYQNVKNAAKDPSAAGDLSMIFAYMKILDPNSVVREQEFANAQNAAGVPDRVRNVYNRIMSGERLNPAQRADFLAQADKLHGSSQRQYESIRRQYGEIAKKSKARPDQVLIDFSEVAENPEAMQQGAAAPQAGAAPQAAAAPAQPQAAQPAPSKSAVSPDAIKVLRSNPTPERRKMFDEVFGPGAAARALALRPR